MDEYDFLCYIVFDTYILFLVLISNPKIICAMHSFRFWHCYLVSSEVKTEVLVCWQKKNYRNVRLLPPYSWLEVNGNDSLRSMEEDGLITRTVFPEVPPRVEYALSDLGETMRPILNAMQEWGTNYKNGTM